MSGKIANRDFFFYVHASVTIFFMFGFGYLPPIYPLEQLGMQVLGIFIALLYAWTFIGFIWPSLLGFIALALTGYDSLLNLLRAGFGNDIVLLCLFMFIFSEYLYRSGNVQYLAEFLVSRKICVGKPWMLTFMLFLGAYILGSMVSLAGSIILMWSIFYSVCEIVGYQKGDKWPAYVLVGIAYSCMLGFNIFPYKVVSALALSTFTSFTGQVVPFSTFVMISLILSLCALMAFLLVGKFIIRPDVSLLTTNVDFFSNMRRKKLTKEAKLGFISIFVLLLMMITPEYFSKYPLIHIFSQLKPLGCTIFVVLILTTIQIDQKPVLDFVNYLRTGNIVWDVVIMLTITMPIAQALSSEKTKIMDMISYYGQYIFADMGPIVFIIGFTVFAAILTQIAHNMVLAAVLTPIMCNFGKMAGTNLTMAIIMLCFSLGIALATPGASAPGALVYANTEWITTSRAYQYSICSVLCSTTVIIIIGLLLSHVL